MFTRQHYKAIAEIVKSNTHIRKLRCPPNENLGLLFSDEFGKDLADYFAEDNSRFDREKFLAACGL